MNWWRMFDDMMHRGLWFAPTWLMMQSRLRDITWCRTGCRTNRCRLDMVWTSPIDYQRGIWHWHFLSPCEVGRRDTTAHAQHRTICHASNNASLGRVDLFFNPRLPPSRIDNGNIIRY